MGKWNHYSQFSDKQSNAYRKELSWLHSVNEPRVQERQQKKDQQSYICISAASLSYISTGEAIAS